MEIDFALINEAAGFNEDYTDDYRSIINEAAKQLGIEEDLELILILGIYQIIDYIAAPPLFRGPGGLVSAICNLLIGLLLICSPIIGTSISCACSI